MSLDHPQIARFANRLADIARDIARSHFRTTTAFESKSDKSPVTIADRAIEDALRQAIEKTYPGHGIQGEERGVSNAGREMWVLDPIDGTLSFMMGMPTFGSLIAYAEDGAPVVGVVELPALKERLTGYDGATTFNGQPVRVSGCAALSEARLSTSGPDYFRDEDWARFDAASRRGAARRFGGECAAYALLACGYCDAVADGSMAPHDFMPLVPVIEGAGGVITDWQGRALTLAYSGAVLASSSRKLHDQLLRALDAGASPDRAAS